MLQSVHANGSSKFILEIFEDHVHVGTKVLMHKVTEFRLCNITLFPFWFSLSLVDCGSSCRGFAGGAKLWQRGKVLPCSTLLPYSTVTNGNLGHWIIDRSHFLFSTAFESFLGLFKASVVAYSCTRHIAFWLCHTILVAHAKSSCLAQPVNKCPLGRTGEILVFALQRL